MKAALRIRIDFDEGTILSPGKVRLLELVDEYGSIEQAAAVIEMTNDCAREIIDKLEGLFGASLIATEPKGENGTRSELTELARKVIERYRAAERTSALAAEGLVDDLLSLAPDKQGGAGLG